jgi:predicted DNA-binding protein
MEENILDNSSTEVEFNSEVVDNQESTEIQEEQAFSLYQTLNAKLGLDINGEFGEDEDGIIKWATQYKDIEFQRDRELKRENAPLLYELEELVMQGEDISEVIKQLANNMQGVIPFDENNISMQKEIVLQDMLSKSNNFFTKEDIEQRINQLEDEGKLTNYAKQIVDGKNQQLAERNQQVIEGRKQARQQYDGVVNNNLTQIANYISQGKLGNLEIPVNERQKLMDWIDNSAMLDSDEQGNIYAKQYIKTPEDLQSLFFRYRNGNVEDIIKLKASTMNANKLFNKKVETKKTETTGNSVMDFIKKNSIIQ